MKNAIYILLMSLSTFHCYSQDNFNKAIIQLQNDYQYFSEINDNGKYYSIQDSIDTKLKNQFQKCSKYQKSLGQVDFNKLKSIKSTNIKSKDTLEKNLYLRVQIQEWRFINNEEAKFFNENLEKASRKGSIECIRKGGFTWWMKNNKIYVIISNAYRFSFEFDNIKESLNKQL